MVYLVNLALNRSLEMTAPAVLSLLESATRSSDLRRHPQFVIPTRERYDLGA
jgi:hypothetical protein